MASITPMIKVRCCLLPAVQTAGSGKREVVFASVLLNTVDRVEIDIKRAVNSRFKKIFIVYCYQKPALIDTRYSNVYE